MRSFIHRRSLDLLQAALLAGLALVDLPGRAQGVSLPLSLDQAVQAATAQSQRVVAAQAQTRAARERERAAGALPDPVLTFGVSDLPVNGRDRFSLTRDSDTQRSIGVMQEVTRGDKRLARTERAQREVEAARIAQQATLADLQRDTALAWIDRAWQESLRDALRTGLAQSEQQAEAAQLLYRNGRGTQADVYAARGEVEQLRDRIVQTDSQIAVATTRLARWIGDAAQRPLGARPAFELPDWAHAEASPDALASHLARHPLIAAAMQQQALAESDAALARAARQADWSVGLSYSQRGPAYSNMVSLSLSVPFQWDPQNRQDRELAARLAGIERARAEREDVQRAHEAEVRTLLHEWRGADERVRRYDSTRLPLAAQRSAAALTAYGSGTGSLTLLLDARRAELELHIERLRVEMDQARLWAQLNYLLPADAPAESSDATLAGTPPRTTP